MQYFKRSKKSRYIDQTITCDSCEQKYETISGLKEKISSKYYARFIGILLSLFYQFWSSKTVIGL